MSIDIWTSLRILVLASLVTCSTQAQQIAYLLPDIGAPGMNTYVEFISPADRQGNFGQDGFYLNENGSAVRIVCARPADTALIVIGPLVVSWNGRMISTQIFVREGVTPNSTLWSNLSPGFRIPVKAVVNGSSSNIDTFYIVRPAPYETYANASYLGDPARIARSRRGALIFDSLEIDGAGSVYISNNDTDPITEGNQGMLPLVLLSKGPIRHAHVGGWISICGNGYLAGPGGGGGGGRYCDVSGGGMNGGDGFTGGGRGGQNGSGVPFSSDIFQKPGIGTGPAIGNTGGSLNGVAGGTADAHESAGGGTGHPFGMSGEGCADGYVCHPDGHQGGGSGQSQNKPGGAGGYATAGEPAGTAGGRAHGNAQLVPLAGGSGGASGNPQGLYVCSGNGGGAGGAISIFGRDIEYFAVNAAGAQGEYGNSDSHGGCGSGGGVILGAKQLLIPSTVSVVGGSGPNLQKGGDGYVRIDGNLKSDIGQQTSLKRGPSTDTSHWVPVSFILHGTGDGNKITVYLKDGEDPWRAVGTASGYSNNTWSIPVTLTGRSPESWLVAAQTVPSPATGLFDAEPSMLLTQCAANVLRFMQVPRIVSTDSINFIPLACLVSEDTTIYVRNAGFGPLQIDTARVTGTGFSLVSPAIPVTIAPGDSLPFVLRFSPPAGAYGPYTGTLVIRSNDTSRMRNPLVIPISGVYVNVKMTTSVNELHFDTLFTCNGPTRERSLLLYNGGTATVWSRCMLASGLNFRILSPLPPEFFLTATKDTPIVIRFAPQSYGRKVDTLIIESVYRGCLVSNRIPMDGDYELINHTVVPSVTFSTMLCSSAPLDTIITIRNTGTYPLSFAQPAIDYTSFKLISPAFPLSLGAGDSMRLHLRFNGTTVGPTSGSIIIPYQPCGRQMYMQLIARRDSAGLSGTDVHFDFVQQGSFPARKNSIITNTGSVPVTISSIGVNGASVFSPVASFPITINPGDSIPVIVEFTDPGIDGDFAATFTIEYSPRCSPSEFQVGGSRGGAIATIQPGDLEGPTGSTITLPIYLRASTNLMMTGATGISTTLRFNSDVLYPLFSPKGSVVGNERVVSVTLPFSSMQGQLLGTLPFVVTLGDADSTAIWLQNSAGVGGTITVTELPGHFTITNICREGGVRHFSTRGTQGLRQNRPNPFNSSTAIEFETIEKGPVRLRVFDRLGRQIAVLYEGTPITGTHTVRFNSGDLPSGLYMYVLETPSEMYKKLMMIVK